ncbi:MAG: hypothetical protein V3R16_02145 [Nitrospirales bacterium]
MTDAATPSGRHAPLGGIDLGELLIFAHWMEQARQAVDKAQPLPATPNLAQGRLRAWVELMRRTDESTRQAEARRTALKETLATQESSVGPLASPFCEKLAELYDHLGRSERAQAVRTRVAAMYVCREDTDPKERRS